MKGLLPTRNEVLRGLLAGVAVSFIAGCSVQGYTSKLTSPPSETTTWLLRTNPNVAALCLASWRDPEAANCEPAAEPELTFTPSNWNKPQTVRVTGVGAGSARISSVFAYGDSNYRNAALNAPVTVREPNGFVLDRTHLDLASGESRGFRVKLKSRPPADARGVWRLKSDLGLAIEPAATGFDRSNWNEYRNIVVTGGSAGRGRVYTEWVGREGDDLQFAEPLALRLEVSSGRAVKVSLWNGADRDGFVRLSEGGSGAGFGVSLSERPTGTVTVSASIGLGAELDAMTGLVPDAPVWESEEVATQPSGPRLGLRAGYGIASGPARWTPYGEARFAGGEQSVREGVRYERGTLRLRPPRRAPETGTEHGIRFVLSVRF